MWAFRGVCAAATLSTALFMGSPYLEAHWQWYDYVADTQDAQVQGAVLALGSTILALTAASMAEESMMAQKRAEANVSELDK